MKFFIAIAALVTVAAADPVLLPGVAEPVPIVGELTPIAIEPAVIETGPISVVPPIIKVPLPTGQAPLVQNIENAVQQGATIATAPIDSAIVKEIIAAGPVNVVEGIVNPLVVNPIVVNPIVVKPTGGEPVIVGDPIVPQLVNVVGHVIQPFASGAPALPGGIDPETLN